MINYRAAENNFSESNPQQLEPPNSQIATISVIVPLYNNVQFLPAALDSVFAQNFAETEIIVVDDGSTEDIESSLIRYANKIQLVRQENAGSAAARNRGIGLATGKYVVFLDADDLLLLHKFEEQVAILEKRPLLGLVHSGWQRINEAGEHLKTIEPWHNAPTLDLDAWLWKKPVKMGAMLFRRHWLNKVNGFDTELRQSQDVDLMLRLSLAGCTADWLQKPTMQYRVYANSTIRKNALRQQFYATRVLDKFFAHPDAPDHLCKAEPSVRYYNLRWIAWHLFDSGYRQEIMQPLSEAFTHSRYSPQETVLDWTNCFGRYCVANKRPLTSLAQLWPYFHEAAQLESDLHLLERKLNWWMQVETDFSERRWQRMQPEWQMWETAVTVESDLNIPAETIVTYWQQVWSKQSAGKREGAIVALKRFSTLTPAQLVALSQYFIVQQPKIISSAMLTHYWRDLREADLITGVHQHQLVALTLTLFGQLVLEPSWKKAVQVLGAGLGQTAVNPKAFSAWWRFVETAVVYFKETERG